MKKLLFIILLIPAICSAQIKIVNLKDNYVHITVTPDVTIYRYNKNPFGTYNNGLNVETIYAYIGDENYIYNENSGAYIFTENAYNHIFNKLCNKLNSGELKYKDKNGDIITKKKSNNIFIGGQINNQTCVDLMKEIVKNPLGIEIDKVYINPVKNNINKKEK